MKITYIYHSGYLVETEPATFLFDYYKGKLPAFPAEKPLVVFASHKHPDHFDFKIFDLQNHPGGVTYVFGNDIKLSDKYLQRHGVDPAVKEKIYRMQPHTSLTLPDVTIHTLKSTDAGVAFYVKAGEQRIYHAGDLNWWHWDGELGNFNKDQERVYKEEITYLKNILAGESQSEDTSAALDAAFIPLDPRLGAAYCYGMDYFLFRIPVKEVYPMHMWEDYDVIKRYLNYCREQEDKMQYISLIKNPL
ncbi:MAG: MBL fold metallo-hydrolase [Lachnospiraceae bacterium]|nr:MBL fold metallo-hydrolase [Lachnospiraceae bacterium]